MLGHQAILSSSSSGGVNYFEVTYAEMIQLVEDAMLIPGSFYLITDFQTIYDQPDFWLEGAPKEAHELETKVSGIIEPLLCIASGLNILELQVYSLLYSNDVLHYDVRFLQTEIKGTPAKGRITYRQDEQKNVTSYDHHHVYFKRYNSLVGDPLIFPEYRDNGLASAQFLTFTNDSKGNNLVNVVDNSGFLLPNNVFKNTSKYNYFYAGCRNNYFSKAENNRFFDYVLENIVLGFCLKNNISASFSRNKLNEFHYNRLTDSFDNNDSSNEFLYNFATSYISGCIMPTFKNTNVNTYLEEIDFAGALLVASDYTKTIYSDKLLGHRLSYHENDIPIFADITD